MDDYTHYQHFSLIRPHGCVDWQQQVVGPITYASPQHLIGHADQVDAAPSATISHRSENRSWSGFPVPAIAIPLLTKVEFVCSEKHLQALDRAVEESAAILVIGWRGKEVHFNRRLKGRLRNQHLLIADVPDVNPIMTHLLSEWELRSPSSATIESGGFSGLLFGPQRSLDTFLGKLA